MVKNKKQEIIELNYTFTESDGKYIISKLKSFREIFRANFPDAYYHISRKEIYLIEQCCTTFSEYADYLEPRYFGGNQVYYLKKQEECLEYPYLTPLFRKFELRFILWFKYHFMIYPDTSQNLAECYPALEFFYMLMIVASYDTNPGSKRDTWKRARESIKVIANTKNRDDTKFYKHGGGVPIDEIWLILHKLGQSYDLAHRRDLQIWAHVERDCLNQTEKGPYAKFYQHLALGVEIKRPKAGRKRTHDEHCPNCSTLMVIISHHDTYRQHTDYLKCPKCGTKTKKFR
jgi:predicted RNA-binding Zn-ribbon protein involved in translation (DUF1610 family)